MDKSFQKNGYKVVKKAVSTQTTQLLAREFQMARDNIYLAEGIDPNDLYAFRQESFPYAFNWYGLFCFESLMDILTPTISEIVGKELIPCFSFARIYYKGSDLFRHKDRDCCEYSASITIEADKNCEWPLWIQSLTGKEKSCVLNDGDMLVYRGVELDHWRDVFQGTQHKQAFIHYVDANSEYAKYAYDTRPLLGAPAFTKTLTSTFNHIPANR